MTALFVIATSVLLLVLGAGLGLMLRQQLEARDREEFDGKTQLVAYLFAELSSAENIAANADRFSDMAVGHPHLVIGLNRSGTWLVAPPPPFEERIDEGTTRPVPASPAAATWRLADGLWWVRRIPYRTDDGVEFNAYLGLHVDPAQVIVRRFYLSMLAAGVLGTLASGLLGWAVARRGLAPIATVSRDAERVTADRLGGSLLRAEDAPTEVRSLVEAINRMLGRLGDSFRALEEFSADIAHELRTPLNNLMLQTQVTLSRQREADEYRDALHSNLEEVERLQRMVTDMLFLARADRGMFQLNIESVDLFQEAAKVAEFFELAAAEKEASIEVSGFGVAPCDRAMVRRALTNLMSNAVRYSPQEARITVAVAARDDGTCTVDVENPSAPMSVEELSRLFARFSRGAGSDRQAGEGSGLGLSIAASIMRMHAGELQATSLPGTLRFRLVFSPRAQGALRPSGDFSGSEPSSSAGSL